MRVIPVIDVKGGIVVHAVAGQREKYEPIKSKICSSTDPLEVAKTFRNMGFKELYLADLDAIAGGEPYYSLYENIGKTGLSLMVDAGVSSLEKFKKLLKHGVTKVIVGTETLRDLQFLREAARSYSENLVVSIDLYGGKLLSLCEDVKERDPLTVMLSFKDMGVKEFIVLDLSRVGTSKGINLSFIREVVENVEASILVGGGVKDIYDLLKLRDIGVAGVLVATALHNQNITINDLEKEGFL